MINAFNNLCAFVYSRIQVFAKEERGAVDIVAVVVLIGIAVALAVIFRGSIQKLLEDMFNSINTGAMDAVKSSAP